MTNERVTRAGAGMPLRNWVAGGLLVALGMTGCIHSRRLDAEDTRGIQKLAIVARVMAPPHIEVAAEDPAVARAFPAETAQASDAKLYDLLVEQVKRFEVEERLRASFLESMPDTPPWSTALSAVEVSTALQTLLVEERPATIDYEALAARGADAVLELTVQDYGLHSRNGRTGYYLKIDGRLHLLGGGTLWKRSLAFDELSDPAAEPVDAVALAKGGYRDSITLFLKRVGEQIAAQLVQR